MGYEYDQWKTISDIDYEESFKTEINDTEEDLKLFMEITNGYTTSK